MRLANQGGRLGSSCKAGNRLDCPNHERPRLSICREHSGPTGKCNTERQSKEPPVNLKTETRTLLCDWAKRCYHVDPMLHSLQPNARESATVDSPFVRRSVWQILA